MNSFKIYSTVSRFRFFRKKEEIRLVGEITFLDNRILVNDEVFSIDALEKLAFTNFDDYQGKVLTDEKLSEGLDNTIELYLKDSKRLIYNIQQQYRYQLRELRPQLVNYHNDGKLDFLNLIAILGIDGYNAIRIFKNSLPEGGDVKSY